MTATTYTFERHRWGQQGPHADSIYEFVIRSDTDLPDNTADALAKVLGRPAYRLEDAPSPLSPILTTRERLSPQAVRYVVTEAYTD